MLTNQRRVYVDQSERRSSKLDQSEPSSRMRMRGTLLRIQKAQDLHFSHSLL